jgi:hypothetical protein
MRKFSVILFLVVVISTLFNNLTRANQVNEPIAITRLQMRDKVVLIKNESDGIKYSIKSQDGEVLSANISETELASKYPDLYQTIRPALASPNSAADMGIWAGM